MGTCCSKSTRYKHLSRRQKGKQNIMLEELVTKARVDFSNTEIQDIQRAVSEMIDRIKTRINEHGVFRISRTEICGSMAEETAMWKEFLSEETYIEFDFLAVLHVKAACDIKPDCPECFYFNTLKANFELLERYHRSLYHSDINNKRDQKKIFKECFTRETYNSLASCGCLEVIHKYRNSWSEYTLKPSSTCSKTQQGCEKCTVDRPTGTLRVETSEGSGGGPTLIFKWISKAKTLCSRNKWCLPETENMENLTIHIDFLPALEVFQSNQQSADSAACSSSGFVLNPTSSEYEHYCFLVPKQCVPCDRKGHKGTWRRSGCRAEIDTFVNKMSAKHRKVYQILKLVYRSGFLILFNYHLKIAVLNHSSSCEGEGEDCIKCLFKVLDEIQHAYETRHLKSFHSQANLLGSVISDSISQSSVDILGCCRVYCSISANDILNQSTGKEALFSALAESDSVSAFLEKFETGLEPIFDIFSLYMSDKINFEILSLKGQGSRTC